MALKEALSGIALAITLMAGAASAATLSIDGGTAGTIPGGKAKNDALMPLFGTNSLDGFYNAAIRLAGPAKVTFSYFGTEASWKNTFNTATGSFSNKSQPNNTWSVSGFESYMEIMGAGLAQFSFSTNGGGGASPTPPTTVKNGENDTTGVTFFASIAGNPTGRTGKSVWLFFDDGGAGPNDNHDDMVVRMDVAPIPLPAAGFMLLAGLGGLALVKRRKAA